MIEENKVLNPNSNNDLETNYIHNELQTNKRIKRVVLKLIKYLLIYGLLASWAFMVLFPFFYMVLTSFKSLDSYYSEMTPKLYTSSPTFENYVAAFTSVNMLRAIFNTLIYAFTTTFLMVIVCILAAFAFARLNFRFKNAIFTIFLATMMIPNELVIVTNYQTAVNLGLRNTYVGLILPSVLSVFYIYLLRQNFMQVPDSMYYAARVDGCTDFRYLCKVLLPLSKPTIVTITILKLIECWNSYVWPRLISTKEDFYLVSNVIQQIRDVSSYGKPHITAMMAAVVIVSIPLIVLFVAFRKQIMSGVAKTGTKG